MWWKDVALNRNEEIVVYLGDEIRVRVTRDHHGRHKIGILAPREMPIVAETGPKPIAVAKPR